MKKTALITILVVGTATAGIAHQGVQNKVVMARMMLMESIAKATGTLGDMAKGKTTFDAAVATAAKDTLIAHAAEVAPRFEAQETDPKSEALPAIWTDWDGFLKANSTFAAAANGLNTTDLNGLRGTMGALGQSCGGCHEGYRIKK